MANIRPAVIESVHLLDWNAYRVRVWREQSAVSDSYRQDETELHNLYIGLSDGDSPSHWAEKFLQLDRVNAVEVFVPRTKFCIVLYRDWP